MPLSAINCSSFTKQLAQQISYVIDTVASGAKQLQVESIASTVHLRNQQGKRYNRMIQSKLTTQGRGESKESFKLALIFKV